MRTRASLEQIFGSRVRVRLLRLFLENPEQQFYVREITRCTKSHIHSVRRELSNLSKIGLVHIYEDVKASPKKGNGIQRKYYEANPACGIFQELRSLFFKGRMFLQEEFARQLERAGSIKYLALTGFFVELQGSATDLFIVGRVNKTKCARLIREFENAFGRTVNYTILPLREFMERKELTDRFLYDFFGSKKIVLINKLPLAMQIGATISPTYDAKKPADGKP